MLQDNLTVNDAGHLAVAGVDTVTLAEQYGTPLYVMDEARLRGNMRVYAEAMRSFPAGSMAYYASKALSFKEIYRIAAEEGIGADVVSGGELYTALAAGFPAEKIGFHGSAKTEAEICYAVESGVGYIIADNPEELRRISRIASEKGVLQQVLLRLTPGIDPHTFDAVNTGRVDSKFGVAIETGQADEFVRFALSLPGLTVKGFHCHIGSQIAEPKPFTDAAEIMTAYMAKIRDELGYTASVLNLGGGIGVPYEEGDPAPDAGAILRDIAAYMKARCAALALPQPAVFVEPGRGIVGDAGVTLYTVENVKTIPGYKSYISIDGGMGDNPRFALYGAIHTVLNASRAGEQADFVADVAGRCCESDDLIRPDARLQHTEAGDTLAVLVTGAYNYAMASNYNRVPRPPIVMLRDGASRVVLRRETYEDLVACDV